MLGWRQAGAVTAVKVTTLHVVAAVQKEPPDLAVWSTVSQGECDRLVPRRRPGLRELSLGSMKMMIFFFFLAEFIYSHNLTVDGREILFHIWDVPSSQVRGLHSCHPFSPQDKKNSPKRYLWGATGWELQLSKGLASDGL